MWSIALLSAALSLLQVSLAAGAELRLRKDFLEKQQDRTLVTTLARFDHVKAAVNSLGKDCDLHAPLRSEDIQIPIVGEFMNACSMGPQPGDVEALTSAGPASITGVLRVWFEHPGDANEVLSEEQVIPAYLSSNPAHAVEIHPITKVGQRSFTANLAPIEQDGNEFTAKALPALMNLLKRKVTVQEFDGEDGDPYVSIGSGCCLPNYFKLKAAVQKKPRPTAGGDGHVTEIQILRGNSIIAKDLRLFSVDGTAADKAFAKLAQGGRFTFWGITRLDLKQILQLVKNHPGEERPVPIEFVLLAVVPSTTH